MTHISLIVDVADTAGIPLDELEDHLRRDCKALMWREELISKSKLRKEPMQCILCGEMCPMEDLRRHEVSHFPISTCFT